MEVLDDGNFQGKLGQVRRQPSERDRARLIRNLSENFQLSAAQAIALVAECHDFESKMAASKAVLEAVPADQREAFAHDGMAKLFRFEDDRKEFCALVGVEFVPPASAGGPGGPQVARFDNHNTAGYTI